MSFLTDPRRSLIKPHLINLSGSGATFDEIIVERNVERCDTLADGPSLKSVRHAIVVHARHPSKLECRVNGVRQTATFAEGDMIVSPAGLVATPHWSDDVEILLLALNPGFVARVAEEMRGGVVEVIPQFHFRDELLRCLANGLVGEFERETPPERLYVESLAYALTTHLIKNYSVRGIAPPPRGGLAPRRLSRVLEYMRERLGGELSLADMAAAAEISPSHFAVLFKRATGMSPHRYALNQRIERARELLQDVAIPISEIAAQTGFADQSHLTRVMRRHTGLTPKMIRDQGGVERRKIARIFQKS
jgi:AraC family transcriptional regulator